MNTTPLHPKALTKLPDMAVYGPGVAGSVKRKTLVTVPPIQGSEFKPAGQRIIQIYLPKNGFYNGVNSYLTFTHKCDWAATDAYEGPALSSSASNWIQRLRIKVGGRIVEDIDDYNVLHEIIKTSVVTAPYRDSLAGQCEGYEPSFVPKVIEDCVVDTNVTALPDTVPQYAATNDTNTWTDCGATTLETLANRSKPIRRGVWVNANRTGKPYFTSSNSALVGADAEHTLQHWSRRGRQYQIKILSGFLESRRYLPTRFMPPVEIELTLSDFERSHVWQPERPAATTANKPAVFANNDIFLASRYFDGSAGAETGAARTVTQTGQRTYTISNVNLMAEMLEFDETFYQAFEMSLAQGVTIPYTTFTNHTFANDGAGAVDIQVAERVRSAKALFAVMRRQKDLSYPAYPKFMFSQNGVTQFQVKIGTQYFPMQPIVCEDATTPANGYDLYSGVRLLELTKCISAMADTTHAMTTNARTENENFVIGVDLDREFNRLSGLDTTKGLPLFLNLKFASGNTSLYSKACQINVFVHFDMFVDLFPGEVIEVLN